jgi:hypothetical protein
MVSHADVLQIVLTVRDPDKWYDSYVSSLLWLYRTWWFKPWAAILLHGRKLQVLPAAPDLAPAA